MSRPRLRAGAWTRLGRIERINLMILSHMPRWTAADVARFKRAGEEMAARVAEICD